MKKQATKSKSADASFDYKSIQSFEQACIQTGRDPLKLPDVSMLPIEHQKAITAFYKLTIVIEAINNDPAFPDWSNASQWKYYPWFWIKASKAKPSGSGFSDSYYGGSGTRTAVGSRLCCKSGEMSNYVATQFEQLYIDMLLK